MLNMSAYRGRNLSQISELKVIVVADVLCTVFTICDVSYKRERNLYKYLHKKQTGNKCQFFENNVKKRKNTEFLKIPPTVRFSVVGPMRQNFGKHTRRTCFHFTFIGQHLFVHGSQATACRSQVYHSFKKKNKNKNVTQRTHSYLCR